MKMIKIYYTISVFFILLIITSSCSISARKDFINNIMGTYESYRTAGAINIVDSEGNISENGAAIYSLYHVFTVNKAIYCVIDSTDGVGYVPVFYQTDMLYIGNSSENYEGINFSTVSLFGMKIN